MLQGMREKTQGWLAWLIVIAVCFTLAGFGIKSYMQSNGPGTIAKVNGTEISQYQVNATYERLRQQRQMQLGADFSNDPQADAQIHNQALNQIIVSTLLSGAAKAQGYRVTENEVDDTLANMPIFQVNGQFSRDRFREILNNTLYTESSFLDALSKDLLISQVQTGFTTSAFALPNEVTDLIRLVGQKRDVAYFIIPKEKLANSIFVPEKDIQTYYQQNQTQFSQAEQVSIDYLEVSLSDLVRNQQFSEAALLQFYNENPDLFTKPARWKIARIFIKTPSQATAQQISDTQTKVTTLVQRLRNGENFAKLASQFSEDPESAENGGLMPWIVKGNLNPELEKSISELKPNEVSNPIKTKEGFHIIKLIAFEKENLAPYANVKTQVFNTLSQQKAQKIFAEKVDKLTNLSYANPNTLDVAAKELSLTIKESPLFGPQGGKEGVIANPKVVKAAFNPDVLVRGNNSDLIELNADTFLVIRVKQHLPASTKPYAMVKESILHNLKTVAAQHAAQQQGNAMIEQIRSGKAQAKTLADSKDYTWVEKADAGRFDSKFNSMILNTAFRLPRPKDNNLPTVAGITLPSGDYAIILVNKVSDGHPNTSLELAKEEQRIFREQLETSLGELDYRLYVSSLEKKAKVVIKH